MNALSKIRESGFEIGLRESELSIKPFSKLSPTQLDFLKSHKAEIIQALKLEQAANDQPYPFDDRHHCRECQKLINRRCVASLIHLRSYGKSGQWINCLIIDSKNGTPTRQWPWLVHRSNLCGLHHG